MVSFLRGRYLVWALILLFAATAWAGDAVPFSGVVKKVIEKKMKVSIKDPETKKRFTVILDDKSKLNGYSGIADVKKGDAVIGHYVVTDKGLYIATELSKK